MEEIKKKKKYKPLGNRVIVEKMAEEEGITESGIHTGAILKTRGKILKRGDKVTFVEVGDIIIFEPGAEIPMNPLEPNVIWMEEDQIVAIETEE